MRNMRKLNNKLMRAKKELKFAERLLLTANQKYAEGYDREYYTYGNASELENEINNAEMFYNQKARRYADTLHKMGRDDEIVEAGGWFLL